MKNSCKRMCLVFRETLALINGKKNPQKHPRNVEESSIKLFYSESFTIKLCIIFFNKLHLDKCNQSKTPLMSASGREGERAPVCAHTPGGEGGGTLTCLLRTRFISALKRKLQLAKLSCCQVCSFLLVSIYNYHRTEMKLKHKLQNITVGMH